MEQGLSPTTTEKPRIKTVWIDVSVVLVLPKGFVAGIPRTILKIIECWLENPMTGVTAKYCAFSDEHGVMEVSADYLREFTRSKLRPQTTTEAPPVNEPIPPPPKRSLTKKLVPWRVRGFIRDYWIGQPPRGRFWIIPVGLRRLVKYFWFGPPHLRQVQQQSLPIKSGIPCLVSPQTNVFDPITFGSEDVVISLGAQWITQNLIEMTQAHQEREKFHYVSLVYDLIPILSPHYFDRTLIDMYTPAAEWQLRQSNILLSISEHVRKDIIQYAKDHRLNIGPVETIILGSDSTKSNTTIPKEITRPYILTVGSIETRKNHYGMYLAWKKLARILGPDKVPLLIMAGKPAWQGEQIIHLVQNDPDSKNIIQIRTKVSDADLDWLYQNCLFTIYPSLNEGWGLPVEESFAYGKLCVTTTSASLPEVGGTFADYVEPEDIDSLVKGVIKALDPSYRAEREAHIRNNYRPNTWLACAQQIENIVQRYFEFIK